MIRRSDKSCQFYTLAKNAHSACLLPNKRVAVASSFGGDELLIYNLEKPQDGPFPTGDENPTQGRSWCLWDKKMNRLWALGSDELLLIDIAGANQEVELDTERRFKLPTPGGHDLTQSRDEAILFITVDSHVYRFDKKKSQFTTDPFLADHKKVKSMTQHPTTGEIVYHQGTPNTWWSNIIRFVGPRKSITLPDRHLYKVRWDTTE